MAAYHVPVVFACLSALAMVGVVRGQTTPLQYTSAHNLPRSSVGVGPMVWSASLASIAQSYANQLTVDCTLVPSEGPFGENLYLGSNSAVTGTMAVQAWVSEKQYYNYSSNTCAVGKVCSHYTQVVWRTSVNLGCARVTCNSGSVIVLCYYNPPGNLPGLKPY